MKNVLLLFLHFVSIVIRLIRPGGTKTVLAESLLLKHQLILLNRSRKRAPNLSPLLLEWRIILFLEVLASMLTNGGRIVGAGSKHPWPRKLRIRHPQVEK